MRSRTSNGQSSASYLRKDCPQSRRTHSPHSHLSLKEAAFNFQSWERMSWPTRCSHQESDPHRCPSPEAGYRWQERNSWRPLCPHLKTKVLSPYIMVPGLLCSGVNVSVNSSSLQGKALHWMQHCSVSEMESVLLSIYCWLRTCSWPQTCNNPVSWGVWEVAHI